MDALNLRQWAAGLQTGEHVALAAALLWEPAVADITAEEFQALVHRVLARLDRLGWELQPQEVGSTQENRPATG